MSTDLFSRPFVEALARGALVSQHCEACGTVQRLARLGCTQCGASRLAWRPASAQGTVFAVTVVSRAPSDEFRPLAPYGLALVDLDDGARLMGHAPLELRVGQRVRASVFALGERHLVRFDPLTEA